MGGYRKVTENKLDKDRENRASKDKKDRNETQIKTSAAQIKYLGKMYQFCKSKNITLVLLNVPMHMEMQEHFVSYDEQYHEIASTICPEAVVVDHSAFQLSDDHYRDLTHLNYKGAKVYSEFLSKNGLTTSLP